MKKEKKEVMIKGISLHVIAYTLLGMILTFLGVPTQITMILVFVLLWGLLVISYAYYHEK